MIREHLVRVFPDLGIVKVEVDDAPEDQDGEAGYIRTREGRLVVDHFGDGFRHAFKLLAGLAALGETVDEDHPGMLLWEDPELFMHPVSLNRLLGELVAMTRDKPIQVFLSSQSMETIALLTDQVRQAKVEDGYRVARLRLENGRLYAAQYHYEDLLVWLEVGRDTRSRQDTKLPITYRYRVPTETSAEDL